MRKGFSRKPQADEPATPVKNYITPSGLQRLKDEHRFLLTRERPAVVEVVAWAASNGDRSENADYQYNKRRLRQIDRRIYVLTKRIDAAEIIDPRPYATGEIKKTFQTYPKIGTLLPAMGYSDRQIRDLEATINKVPCDVVIIGTPIDLKRIVKIKKPALRVTYELEEIGEPSLRSILGEFTRNVKRS